MHEHEPVERVVETPVQEESGNVQANVAGESAVGTTQTEGEPTPGGLFDGMTGEQLHESYKNIQGKFTTTNEELKGIQDRLGAFDRFGGAEKTQEYLDTLINDPSFHEWAKTKNQQNFLGGEEMDAETQKAMTLVQDIAGQIAEQKIQSVLGTQVQPFLDQQKDKALEANFTAMDEKHGEGWRELQPAMQEMAQMLPEEIQDNPPMEVLENLYAASLRQSGKFDEYAAQMYEKKLKASKSMSTEKPSSGPTGQGTRPAPKTIREAAEQAKQTLGGGINDWK